MLYYNCKNIIIERKLIVNEISLKKLFTYNNNVYHIGEKFKSLERSFLKSSSKTKTSAVTGAKLIMASCLCGQKSINELISTIHNKETSFKNLFDRKEYIPKMHGLRDCISNTDYKQIEEINYSVIEKAKENKIFKKNLVDGLMVVAHDGVEICETNKNITNLPEREHKDGNINKYIKYLCSMNIGPEVNLVLMTKQMTEREKVLTESGKKKAKTIGETTAYLEMLPLLNKLVGRNIDVNVFDALYLNCNVMNEIDKNNQYFVIRMEDKTRHIYKDAEGLFKESKPIEEYELVEITRKIKVKYSKEAKHKDYEKAKKKIEKRKITDKPIGENIFIKKEISNKKNSIKTTEIYEKVIRKIQVWDETGFEYSNYKNKLRIIRSIENYKSDNKIKTQEVYIATNMLEHERSTIIKIMHLRWNIENCGFRKLKQQYKLDHIFIGDFNSINYIFQMIILVNNLLELYLKIRLKDVIELTYVMINKIFEKQFQNIVDIGKIMLGVSG